MVDSRVTSNNEFADAYKKEKIVRGKCIVRTMQLPIDRICKKKRTSFGSLKKNQKNCYQVLPPWNKKLLKVDIWEEALITTIYKKCSFRKKLVASNKLNMPLLIH